MRVAGAGDVLGGGAELHGDARFRDHVAGIGADEMHAERMIAGDLARERANTLLDVIGLDEWLHRCGKGEPPAGLSGSGRKGNIAAQS